MIGKALRKGFIAALGMVFLQAGTASATPSTHIWAPSTDVQAYGVFHLTHDVYVPAKTDKNGNRPNTVTNLGLTTGVLPYEKVNMEVGFDHIAGLGAQDEYPYYLNAKVGTPEDALGKGIPAIALGVYGVGTRSVDPSRTDYNVYYGKVGKTLPVVGRISVGYYQGNDKLLLDDQGKKDNSGILLCWERTISEISDNLWLAVDYQGGKNSLGALNYGFAWKFAPNTSVIFGYDDYNNPDLVDTVTVQLDIDFDVFSGKK